MIQLQKLLQGNGNDNGISNPGSITNTFILRLSVFNTNAAAAAAAAAAADNTSTSAAAAAANPQAAAPLRVPTELPSLNFSPIHKCQGCTAAAISPTSRKLLGNSKRPAMGT